MASKEKKAARRSRRKEQRRERRAVYTIEAADHELYIYEPIGFWGVSSASVSEWVEAHEHLAEIVVRLNSSGGDVFEGLAIYNLLAQSPARVIVKIDGVALSMASVIAMAGDEIHMAENGLMMVHDPRSGADGTSDELREQAMLLDKAAGVLRDTYAKRTGLSAEQIADFMAETKWLDAEEALELGFVTKIVESKAMAASADLGGFAVPQAYREKLSAALPAELVEQDDPSLPIEEGFTMDEKLRALCVKLGMDESLTDEQAQTWLVENLEKVQAASQQPAPQAAATPPAAAAQPAPQAAPDVAALVAEALKAHREQEEARITAFRTQVDDLVDVALGELAPAELQALYALGDMTEVRKRIKDLKAAREDQYDVAISFSDTQPRDRHVLALGTALTMKSMGSDDGLTDEQKKSGWEKFRSASLLNICRECLLVDGVSYRQLDRLSNAEIAQAALGFPQMTSLRASGLATHVTGTLANITRDAFHKTLLMGYEEAPRTWMGPFRQGASVSDFKTIHRVRLGAVPNLADWPENTKPNEAKLNDQEVTYAVEAKAEKVCFSWQMFVNDDMDALTRVPRMLGDAASRTVNSAAWAQITGNPTMPYDSVTLFSVASGNRKNDNHIDSGGAPSVAQFNTMKKLMRLQTGLNTPEENESEDILNLQPRFLAVPAALEGTAEEIVRSTGSPTDNKSSAVYNPHRSLELIVEPLLDANSATAYYMFCDPIRCETVEVTFLQGQETPLVTDWVDNETLSRNFLVVQSFAAKAIDHRGMVKNDGA